MAKLVVTGARPPLYIQQGGDAGGSAAAAAAAASDPVVEAKEAASAEAEEVLLSVAGLSIKPLDISAEAIEHIYADTSQYSITPTSFAYRVLLKGGVSDKLFIDQYKFGDNEVLRFGINHMAITRQQIEGEEFKVLVPVPAPVSSPAPSHSPALQPSPSPPEGGSDNASKSPSKQQSTRSSNKSKYTKTEVEAINHHSLEKEVFGKAIDHLLKEGEDDKTALVDIFARSTPDGAIKLLANGYAEVHTVLLYKNPVTPEGKYEVLVIDPSNFLYTSHMANEDIVPPHPLLAKVTTMHADVI